MDTKDHSENVANISDEYTAGLSITTAFLFMASTTTTVSLVAITLRNLHFISTREAGSPGLDGILETITMEKTSDARQAEALC